MLRTHCHWDLSKIEWEDFWRLFCQDLKVWYDFLFLPSLGLLLHQAHGLCSSQKVVSVWWYSIFPFLFLSSSIVTSTSTFSLYIMNEHWWQFAARCCIILKLIKNEWQMFSRIKLIVNITINKKNKSVLPTKYVRGFQSKRTCQSFNFHNLDLWTFIAQKIHGLPMKLKPFQI